MLEDILNHDERIRLECLAQATTVGGMTSNPEFILTTAKQFEDYVKGEKEEDASDEGRASSAS